MYSTSKSVTLIAFCLAILVERFSEAHAEDIQGSLVRRTAGRDFALPYTELKICPTLQSRCVFVFTGPNGRFSVNLDPGQYSVTVSDQAKQTYAGQISVVRGTGNYPKIVITP
jgi:hypothetical protein